MEKWAYGVVVVAIILILISFLIAKHSNKLRKAKNYERALKMIPLLIHLPPSTDDINANGRNETDVMNEELDQAQVMYSIIASTLAKGFKTRINGQKHISFEIVAKDGTIKYYAMTPAVLTETVKQAVLSAYPTARVEEVYEDNIFSEEGGVAGVAGGELELKKEFVYPIETYDKLKKDASLAILGALSSAKNGDGMAVQIMIRPTDGGWIKKSTDWVKNIKEGKKNKTFGSTNILEKFGWLIKDLMEALWHPPEMHESEKTEEKVLTNLQQEEIQGIEQKTKYPGFETLIRIIASSKSQPKAEAMAGGVVAAFSQFDSQMNNGFTYNSKQSKELVKDYILRFFPQKQTGMILNSIELASIFHLPSQNSIPNSQVERQLVKQVDGPAKLATEGILLGVNEFRGESKKIYLDDDNRRRHTYVIGQTGMGKSVLLENIAFQDMCDGRSFAFIDPHGDAVEALLQRVPKERIDDVIYFDPADIEHPVGMNMFEFSSPDQKDFIVQEGINMLQSLFDPTNQGFFGPRGQHMFRNAALLLMSDPNGATFVDIPQCFTDPEFVKSKLKYVTDKAVYDYWTKEFPASQKSSDAGEVITWFTSKWGPFLSNTIMRNILGQVKSGFNIREIMDNNKIFLVNLSKGRLGDLNAQLLGMIFVMKFQQAAMSRADTPEDERKDFCLYVDEFQNFATDSFESILSEARKYRLNLIIANQFMTQLTDKIREGILGNVGTIICGRIGVTDADLMVKAFSPTFTAEDLTKTMNHAAIAKVMMFGMPSSPFTMKLLPPMGEPNEDLMNNLKIYTATKYAKTRAEVEEEIKRRWETQKDEQKDARNESTKVIPAGVAENKTLEDTKKKDDFLTNWMERKKEIERKEGEDMKKSAIEQSESQLEGVSTKKVDYSKVGSQKAEEKAFRGKIVEKSEDMNGNQSDSDVLQHEQVIKLR
ncbi:TraM recognition domain-containing protein [Candidatus Saccharibacteria bacterium]|nr:TraM recognition domain-containing protein [Candidatus Saccharibacteria bacterium]